MMVTLAVALIVVAGVVGVIAMRSQRKDVALTNALPPVIENQWTTDQALSVFAEKIIDSGSLEQVAIAVTEPLQRTVGVPGVVMFAHGDGKWFSQRTGEELTAAPEEVHPALNWFLENFDSVFLDARKEARFDDIRSSLVALSQTYDTEVFLPLPHHGKLVAVLGFLRRGGTFRDNERGFIQDLHLELIAAVANVLLDADVASRTKLENEVDVAQHLRREFVPRGGEVVKQGLRMASHFRAGEVQARNNFWSYHETTDGRLLVLVGDVQGEGLAASMMLASVLGAWDALCAVEGDFVQDPGALLAQLNQALFRPGIKQWITCCAAMFDGIKGTVRFSNAGHPFAYHLVDRGGYIFLDSLGGAGPAIGDRPIATFPTSTKQFNAGDLFVSYTQGLVERMRPGGQPYGSQRLWRAMRAAAEKKPDAAAMRDNLLSDLSTWGGAARDDEVLVVVQIEGDPKALTKPDPGKQAPQATT